MLWISFDKGRVAVVHVKLHSVLVTTKPSMKKLRTIHGLRHRTSRKHSDLADREYDAHQDVFLIS